MAADWIKISEDLHEKPEVLQMAAELKTRPEHVAGYCIKFWSWVSRNCPSDTVTGVTLDALESVLSLPHFLHLMVKVGWLEYIESTSGAKIIIPNFERHLSQGAKRRALAAEKKRHQRASPNCPDSVPNLSPQIGDQRREEKRRVSTKRKYTKKSSSNPPEVTDVAHYCQERGNRIDPQQFIDYYQARGWKLKGGTTMKDWKAAVRTWERNGQAADAQDKPYVPPSKRRKSRAELITEKRYRLIKAGHNEAREWSNDEIASVDEAALTNQNSDYPNSPQKVAT